MTDQEIIQGLIDRDPKVTQQIFYQDCRPMFYSIIGKVFSTRVDYDELINELYHTALGINGIPNVQVGKKVHINLNPQSSSPSILTCDALTDSQSWTDSHIVNQALGYCGTYSGNDNQAYYQVAYKSAIGVLSLFDTNNVLVAKYYPALRKIDGTIGIYDTVGNSFHTASDLDVVTVGSSNLQWNLFYEEDLQ